MCARAHVCVLSVLVVLLQRVSLCYDIVQSQDYIPAEQRAGKYLLFISLCLYLSVSLSVCVSICLSSHFAVYILTPCLYSVVRWNSQAKHKHICAERWLARQTCGVNISHVASRQCFL